MSTTTEAKPTQAEKIGKQIAATRAKIAEYQRMHAVVPFPFAKVRGAWKGKVHFTDEEIEAAKIRSHGL